MQKRDAVFMQILLDVLIWSNAIFEIYDELSKLSMRLDRRLSGLRNQSVGGYMLPTVIK